MPTARSVADSSEPPGHVSPVGYDGRGRPPDTSKETEMNRSLRGRWLLALAVIAFQIAVGSADADVATDEKTIREQLAHPTKLELTQMPLEDTIAYLMDFHDIGILLDGEELQKAGIDARRLTITKKTSGRLDDTLNDVLPPLNLSFMIDGGVLWITTRAKAKEWQKAYARSRGLK
jgi:hypothetical protein